MKVPIRLAFWAFTASLLATGCESGEVVDPENRSNGGEASLSSDRYSWSPPQNLGPVNSTATDQHPALSKDGLSLYFASNRTGDQNIWVAQRNCTDAADEGCDWGTPVMLGNAVNSQFLDAAPALSRDEHQLFFASQRSNGHCSATTQIPCDRDLWVSYRNHVHDDSGWQAAVNLGDGTNGVNTTGEEVAPSFFENDDSGLPQLFFNDGSLNANGLLVLGNLYVSQLASNGIWGKPLPVSELNTSFSDQRPSVSHDGRELYFHSNRPTPTGEVGVAHVWVATRESVTDAWSAPTLVPSPISDLQTIHPFIHSHGKTETLLLVRSGDIWMSERTRVTGSQ